MGRPDGTAAIDGRLFNADKVGWMTWTGRPDWTAAIGGRLFSAQIWRGARRCGAGGAMAQAPKEALLHDDEDDANINNDVSVHNIFYR